MPSRSYLRAISLREYYTTTRDFIVFDTDPADIAAIEAVFDADFAHRQIVPSDGADLVWSPGSEDQMLAVINGARHTLSIENEEMGDPAITSAIVAAAERGVRVEVTMTTDSSYDSALSAIVRAGGHVHRYADDSWDLYIHAKTTIADAGLSTQTNLRREHQLLERLDGSQPRARNCHLRPDDREGGQRRGDGRLLRLHGRLGLQELFLSRRWGKGEAFSPQTRNPRASREANSRGTERAGRHDRRCADGKRPASPGPTGDAIPPHWAHG